LNPMDRIVSIGKTKKIRIVIGITP
jgi:hypothetical protein